MAADETNFLIDLDGEAPLQQQIRERLIHAIATGILEPGGKAPSSRGLARRLGVSRNTVLIVYQQLTAEGYLVARERQGLFVTDDLVELASRNVTKPAAAGGAEPPPWRALMKRRSRLDLSRRIPPDWMLYPYPFMEGCFDRELSFMAEWRDASRAAFAASQFSAWSMDFCDGDDEKLVHEVRTKILPRRGIEAREDELLITEGWKQALDLIAHLFIDAKSVVALEEPGLPEIRELLRLQRADIVAQPVDDEGMVVDGRLDACGMFIVTPRRHAPTGVAMSRARQKALLRKATDQNALVVEIDASGAGLNEQAPALKARAGGERVLHVSNLCEVFGPGLRLGVVVAPAEVIRELRKIRSLGAGTAPRAAQRIGALLMSLGHHDATATKVRRSIGQRLTALRDALNYYLPRLVLIDPKLSGASIWVKGPPGLKASLLAKEAAKRGVLIEPAERFFHHEASGANAFRMGVSSIPLDRIRDGVAVLAKVVHELTDPTLDRLAADRPIWLRDEQLAHVMPDSTLLCRTAYGDPYSVEVRADGTLIGKAGYAHEDCDEGEWWIEDDHWCRRWKSWSYGDTARFLTVIEGDQIRWYKDDMILFNRGVIVRGAQPSA
ncbi:MAG TPA: PLP-dependent aminotransferase family protein [Caulobacterales bacterium]|nr:PLP-dependent aminotransferase family protein [Caulobacterales bacterium]